MSAASNSFRRNQLFDVLEQIEDVRRNELVNDILDAIQEHQNYQGGLGGLGGGFRNDFSNRRRGGNDVDQLIDLVLGSYGRQGADGWGNNRYDNDVVGEIFGNRGRYGLNNDLEDIVEQLCGNDRYGRDFGNRPHVLEYIVNQLVGGDRNSFRGSQGGNIQQLLHQLLRGRNQRGGYDQDQRLNDVALVIINRLIRNLDGDNSRHGRFELDILDYLLNNYNRGGRQVDLYQVIQRLFNGYDSNSRRRFGEHDIVREIFRLVNDDGNRSFYDDDQDIYRGRNSNILQILRQYFRNQENDEEGRATASTGMTMSKKSFATSSKGKETAAETTGEDSATTTLPTSLSSSGRRAGGETSSADATGVATRTSSPTFLNRTTSREDSDAGTTPTPADPLGTAASSAVTAPTTASTALVAAGSTTMTPGTPASSTVSTNNGGFDLVPLPASEAQGTVTTLENNFATEQQDNESGKVNSGDDDGEDWYE
ncbi:uncharacterized protein SPPG_08504 [Spizellomyces punctatus DAOM BR117]|uniref:Uncharacterized protein n=1 Tax=Spizellomyces punctatus (strain DAOM BR117) TaxID=645134 RepID=A0A0L0H3S1_SPIPD|nr:uncharacterized protein SPPG_08504 [Spizellomyces punctatus DAOM BR117]KNC96115.1 hypothetical protein SPPG_08504 [Spizellomyces punctatus DAOM BR117]|eukprot:XP_016604155.1 hypothetical protein SPPG_08504 [Spizellomyces punctatus DAOM BR117]